MIRSLLISLSLTFLLSLDLGLYRFPVHFNLVVELDEAFISLLLLVLFEETLPVGNHSVHVSLLLDCNVKCTVPFIHFDIQLDCSVEELSLQEDRLSLLDFLAVY